MNIKQNKFWLGFSTWAMEALFIMFVLWLNPVYLCLLIVSAVINLFLRIWFYRARHPKGIAK